MASDSDKGLNNRLMDAEGLQKEFISLEEKRTALVEKEMELYAMKERIDHQETVFLMQQLKLIEDQEKQEQRQYALNEEMKKVYEGEEAMVKLYDIVVGLKQALDEEWEEFRKERLEFIKEKEGIKSTGAEGGQRSDKAKAKEVCQSQIELNLTQREQQVHKERKLLKQEWEELRKEKQSLLNQKEEIEHQRNLLENEKACVESEKMELKQLQKSVKPASRACVHEFEKCATVGELLAEWKYPMTRPSENRVGLIVGDTLAENGNPTEEVSKTPEKKKTRVDVGKGLW